MSILLAFWHPHPLAISRPCVSRFAKKHFAYICLTSFHRSEPLWMGVRVCFALELEGNSFQLLSYRAFYKPFSVVWFLYLIVSDSMRSVPCFAFLFAWLASMCFVFGFYATSWRRLHLTWYSNVTWKILFWGRIFFSGTIAISIFKYHTLITTKKFPVRFLKLTIPRMALHFVFNI